ncbi:WD40-repeat-containing domain [Pseudocohnilembus persalinus]|uniref:WD40-repeat-containing domain n=1 Tax=Pseudocohnilembus persalinus TaxID=266149 RepID=A0A0V0R1Z3_PSEPJ|nr:WD40-repeat-containing domain [Pseudocohnilembus persalinus]|eukprot:KRX08534.1 WD40-repeat-containing domain [Pseudocohnilembus persalinus]
MEQKQNFEIIQMMAPGPKTVRGQTANIHVCKKNKKLVYCSSNIVIIRNLENFQEFQYYQGHRFPVTCAKFSPNGNWVCSVDEKLNVHVWDAIGENHMPKIQLEQFATGIVKDIAWTSDNQRVAIVGEGKEFFAKVFLIDTGSKVGDIGMIGKTLNTVDIRGPRPFRLACAGEEFTTNWYEGPPYKWKKTDKYNTSFVNCLRFSPDGLYFITVSSDKKIILFDGKDGTKLSELQNAHNGGILQCDWLNENEFVTSSADKTIKVWEISDNNIQEKNTLNVKEKPQILDQLLAVQSIDKDQLISLSFGGTFYFNKDIKNENFSYKSVEAHQNIVSAMVHSQDYLITGDLNGKILIWENGVGQIPNGSGHQDTKITKLALNESQSIVYSLSQKGDIKILDLKNKEFSKSYSFEKKVNNIFAVGENYLYILLDKSIEIWRDFESVNSIQLQQIDDPISLAASKDGQYIAVGNSRGKIQIFDEEKVIHQLNHMDFQITSLQFSQKFLYSGDSSGKMNVWDFKEGKSMTQRWSMHSNRVEQILIQDQYIFSVSQDNRVILWDENSLEKISDIKNVHTNQIFSACLSSDGHIFTAGNDWLIKKLKYVKNLNQK